MVSAAPMQIAGVTKDLTSKLTSAGVSSDDANKIKAALNAEAQGAFKLGVDLKLTARTMENGTIEGARVRFEGDVNLVNDATLNLGSLRGAGGEVSFTLTVDQGKASVGDQIDLKLNGQQASTLVQKVQNNEIKLDGRPLEAILKELQNLEASGFKEMTVHITKTGEGDKVQTRETVSVKVDESKVSAEIKAQWAARGIVAEGGIYSVSFRKNDEGRIDTLATFKADAVIGGQATGGVVDKTMVIDGTKRDVKAIDLGNGLWRIAAGAETVSGNTFFARERKLVEGNFFDQVNVTPTIVYEEGGRATTVAFSVEAASPGGKFMLPSVPGQIFRGGAIEYNTMTGQITSSTGAERLTEIRKDGSTFHVVQKANATGGWASIQVKPGYVLGGDFRPTDGLALFAQNGLAGARMYIDGQEVKIKSSGLVQDGLLQLTFSEGIKDREGKSMTGVKLTSSLEVSSRLYAVTEPTKINGVNVTPTNRLDIDRGPQGTNGGGTPSEGLYPIKGNVPLGSPMYHSLANGVPGTEGDSPEERAAWGESIATTQLQSGAPNAALALDRSPQLNSGAAIVEVNRAGTVTGVTNAQIDLTALDTTSPNFKGNVRVTSMEGISPLPDADGRFKIESATTLQIRDNAGAWHDVTAAAGGTITITAGGAVFEGYAAANADSALAVKRGGESGGSSERRDKIDAVLHMDRRTDTHDFVSGTVYIRGEQIAFQGGKLEVVNAKAGSTIMGYTTLTDVASFTLSAKGEIGGLGIGERVEHASGLVFGGVEAASRTTARAASAAADKAEVRVDANGNISLTAPTVQITATRVVTVPVAVADRGAARSGPARPSFFESSPPSESSSISSMVREFSRDVEPVPSSAFGAWRSFSPSPSPPGSTRPPRVAPSSRTPPSIGPRTVR
ncbi:MAG TPA: hypothetical protein PKD69_02635, partial [Elusimicrobiota bacterium]|nr:hypothetical protein [Elusimicrobiota bacterium]